MGLDILRYGGGIVRLPVQGYLILLLGLFAVQYAHADDVFQTRAEASAACNSYEYPYGHHEESCQIDPNYDNPAYGGRYVSKGCRNSYDCDSWTNKKYFMWLEDTCDDVFSHEPIPYQPNWQPTACGYCEGTHHDVGPGGDYRCELKEDLSECREKGEYWVQIGNNPIGTEGYCRPSCESGIAFEGACLEETEDTCTTASPDFQGTIGWGENRAPICSGDRNCADGETFGLIDTGNGTEKACISDDLGPPTCDSDGVLIMDEYGFVCESPEGGPEDEEDQEEPNTDTDGDGEPDEYDRTNDPDAGNKQRDDMIEGIDGTNNRLDKLNKGLGTLEKGLEDVEGAIDDLGNTPDGGFSISELTDAIPEFGETADAFGTAVADTQVAQFAEGLVSLPSNSSCPVYTMPGTSYWEPMTMNLHCEILEDYRSLFSVMFMFFWTGTAIFLFLRA